MTNNNPRRSHFSVRQFQNRGIAGPALLFCLCLPLWASSAAASPATPSFGQLPLSFEPNRGQADPHVQFVSRGPGYTLYLTAAEAILSIQRENIDMQLVGANPASTASGLEPQPGIVNFLAGRDPSKWHSGIPTYAKVNFANVYPGIDLVFYGNQRQLEYDFVVAPGADPKQIAWKIPRAALRLDRDGNLLLQADGPASFRKPTVYQMVNGNRVAIGGRYVIAGNLVRFALGKFDHAKPLIIDPVLTYATYLGGAVNAYSPTDGYVTIGAQPLFSASGVQNPTQGIAVDSQGDVYVTGTTDSTSFPLQNAYLSSGGGLAVDYRASAAFVTKFNPQGTGLVYSTYLSGTNDTNTVGTAIAVDANQNAYVAGYTDDGSFPVTSGAYQTNCPALSGCQPDSDTVGFVTKLGPTGMPVYSTFLGATYDVIYAIAVDAIGQTYVAGYSLDACPYPAPAYNCFPTTSNAVLPGTASVAGVPSTGEPELFTGMAFVSVFDPTLSTLLYSTYIGDNTALIANGTVLPTTFGITSASAVTVDSAGEFFLTGTTVAPNLPTTAGSYQATPLSGSPLMACCMGFVAKFAPVSTGASLDYLTYLSGPQQAVFPSGIVADSAGEAYVTGVNQDQNFPVTEGAYQTTCGITGNTRCNNAFVTKLNMTGSGLVWSTMLGNQLNGANVGVNNVGPILLDSARNVYVTGTSSGTAGDFPQVNPIQASTGGNSPFITEFNPSGSEILFSTFFGAGGLSNSQTAAGLALDGNGYAYLAGNTSASGVAVTAGAFQQNFVGTDDGYVAKICVLLQCPQSITFNGLPNVTYGISPITLGATASSDLAVSYGVTGPATANGSTLTIEGAGQVSVTASQAGTANYLPATPMTQSFTVSPAVLTVTATSPSIVTGQAIPGLTYVLSGFVNGDTAALVSGAPSESTTATAVSAPGNYPVTIALGTLSAANYTFTPVDGALTIGAFTACDVNQHGKSDVSDVQELVNEALGIAPPLNSLQGGGAVNLVDAQIVLNAVLKLGCSRS